MRILSPIPATHYHSPKWRFYFPNHSFDFFCKPGLHTYAIRYAERLHTEKLLKVFRILFTNRQEIQTFSF